MVARDDARSAIAAVFRDEAARICASLVRQLGDFDLAEDLVQDAIVSALERWPVDGVPLKPAPGCSRPRATEA